MEVLYNVWFWLTILAVFPGVFTVVQVARVANWHRYNYAYHSSDTDRHTQDRRLMQGLIAGAMTFIIGALAAICEKFQW